MLSSPNEIPSTWVGKTNCLYPLPLYCPSPGCYSLVGQGHTLVGSYFHALLSNVGGYHSLYSTWVGRIPHCYPHYCHALLSNPMGNGALGSLYTPGWLPRTILYQCMAIPTEIRNHLLCDLPVLAVG
jgi:hypothetical protein